MVILFSCPLLATAVARRSTMQVLSASIGLVPSTRRLAGTTCTSVHRASTRSTTTTGSTASLFALFSNLSTKKRKTK